MSEEPLSELPFDYGTGAPRSPAAPAPKPHRRHQWAVIGTVTGSATVCGRCGKAQNRAAVRRGKNNRLRGNSIEREVCRLLGISRVGQYGGAEDGRGEHFVVQVKSGGAYPERIDGLLRSLTANADQLRAVVHTDAPGPGRRRRALITLDLVEFARWYGKG